MNGSRSFTKPFTTEELQREFDYWRGEKALQGLVEKGLLSKAECNKIMLLNRKSFSPRLAEIMPDSP